MRDYELVQTNLLRPGDVVLASGALLKLGRRSITTDSQGYQRHAFSTEVVDDADYEFAKRDLKGYEVAGNHFILWARVKR